MAIVYNKQYVTSKEELDALYDCSAFTIEGLAEDSIDDLIRWLVKHTGVVQMPTVYIIKGKAMNENYHLSVGNQYTDDSTLVCVPPEAVSDFAELAMPRLEIGARWFDDIVDNNTVRELELKRRKQ